MPASAQDDVNETQRQSLPAPDLTGIETRLDAIASAIADANSEEPPVEEARQAERELAAQQTMARWAMPMFVAAAIATFLTAVGIFLIWQTLLYTRRVTRYTGLASRQAQRATKAAEDAVEITREVGIQQLRAYLTPSEATLVRGSTNGVLVCRFEFRIKNTGQTPAFDIRTLSKLVIGRTEEEFKEAELSGTFASAAMCGHGSHTNISHEFSHEILTDHALGLASVEHRTIWFKGLTTFKNMFDEEWELSYSMRLLDPLALRLDKPVGLSPTTYGNWLRRQTPNSTV